jgi:ketosteroid isomerase-like protein
VSETAVQIVRRAFGDAPLGTVFDMKELLERTEIRVALEELVAPDAVVEFETPSGGLIGDMAGPWRGADGLRAAWREWTGAFDAWSFRGTEWIDAGGGKVLLLGVSLGRMAGSSTAIETRGAALYELEAGKIVRISHFLDQDQARRAAGLAP